MYSITCVMANIISTVLPLRRGTARRRPQELTIDHLVPLLLQLLRDSNR
jgi:hypothetical protein